MARVSTYCNFPGTAEAAFAFYAEVFGTEVTALQRFSELPAGPGTPQLGPGEAERVLHAEVEILAGHVLMATDLLESMGQELRIGNNTTINLEVDDVATAERLFAALGAGGADHAPLMAMPWGSLWGCCLDRYGIRWMINAPLEH